jgi:CBS domain-containing protein
MNNSIVNRISDFLKEHQPFSFLNYDDLQKISESIKILNFDKNSFIFKNNEKLHDCFYLVNAGSVKISVIIDAEEMLVNKCNVGDVFGLRPFFAKNNYQVAAKAREDVILYAIPIAVFKPYLGSNPDILNHLLESFASSNKNSAEFMNVSISNSENIPLSDNQIDLLFFQSLKYNKNPLLITSNELIKDVALKMTDASLDYALIQDKNIPIGIVTDKDFRSKVSTGRISKSTTIDKIMASPVLSVPENISVAEAQLIMIKHGLTHLCCTEDGTNLSGIKGVITEHDLIQAQANNPGVLLKEIKRSQSVKDLKEIRDKLGDVIQSSISKNIPIPHIYGIAGEITLAIVKRSVELSILELGSPPAKYAWLCVGSQGRKEQLLLTDQDSILIFEDVAPEKYRDVKDYFIKLSKKTTSILEKVGFKLCENGHIASNILWCKSLTDWIKQYNNWMNTPGENSNEISSTFFDYEIAIGDNYLEEAITETIFNNVKNNVLFFDYLGNDALRKNAPLTFFKKFNIEEDGPNKGKFDIKTKALLPLIDSARLMTLNLSIKGINNTYLRFKQLAIVDAKHAEIYLNCAEAFLILSKFRTEEGFKNDSDGQFINIDELSKIDKEKLKNALLPMQGMEELLKDRIQLTQFS